MPVNRRLRGAISVAALGVVLTVMIAAIATAWFTLRPKSTNYVTAMAYGEYERARHFLDEQAIEGNPQALNSLANLHYLGLGGAQNHTEALRLYVASARQGFAAAQMNLGHLYRQGLGVAYDPVRAYGWYNMADIHGSPAAEFYIYQINIETTLTPLQRSAALERWRNLSDLLAEKL